MRVCTNVWVIRLSQEDDGLVIFESRAISRYIATKAGSALVPTGNAHDVARFEQALSIEAFNFNPFAEGITWQREFNPLMGRECDEARVRNLSTTLEGKIAGYERILSKSKYLAGEQITIADLFHLPYGVHLAPLNFKYLEDEEKYPNVARYANLAIESIRG
jgi:glutathione S-transferase